VPSGGCGQAVNVSNTARVPYAADHIFVKRSDKKTRHGSVTNSEAIALPRIV